jgi:hypothetical protein
MAKTKVGLTLVLTGVLALLAVGSPALAKDGDVLVRGTCTARSAAKLKLSSEDSRIEVEVEVDQNRNGVPWTVVLTRDGTRRGARHAGDEGAERLVLPAEAGREPGRDGCDPRGRDPARGDLHDSRELDPLTR